MAHPAQGQQPVVTIQAVLQYCSAPRFRLGDNSLDDVNLHNRFLLHNPHLIVGPETTSLGPLDNLPYELMDEILLNMDIPTLIEFRRVNRRARTVVDSNHQYRMLMWHCSSVVRGILAVKATSFDFRTLINTLEAWHCTHCRQRFAGFIYLLTCTRVCYYCFSSDIKFFPLSMPVARRLTTLPPREIKNATSIKALAGNYSETGQYERDMTLYDRMSVHNIDPARSSVLNPPAEKRDRMNGEPRRFMAIISVPWLYTKFPGGAVDWGVYCRMCVRNPGVRIKYTQTQFLHHMSVFGYPPMLGGTTLQHHGHAAWV